MKIALIQFNAIPENIDNNLNKMIFWSKKAKEKNVDIILFHELCLTDFVSDVKKYAELVPIGNACKIIKKYAEDLNLYISFGLIEKENNNYYITQVFLGPNNFFYKYRKTNLYEPSKDSKTAVKRFRDEKTYFQHGIGPNIFNIEKFRATCILCADGGSDKILNQIKNMDIDFVFYPNNRVRWRPEEYWIEIVKKINKPLLITNRIGESWGYSSPGGAMVFNKNGLLIKKANLDEKEEMLVVNTKEFM